MTDDSRTFTPGLRVASTYTIQGEFVPEVGLAAMAEAMVGLPVTAELGYGSTVIGEVTAARVEDGRLMLDVALADGRTMEVVL